MSIDSNPRKRELINRLSAILAASTDVIRSQQPRSPLNRCGYNLADVLGEELASTWRADGRLRGDLGTDYRGHAGDAIAAAASRRGLAALRKPGQGGAIGVR